MMFLYLGTDRKRTHEEAIAALEKLGSGYERLHISDASDVSDLKAALGGSGMFGGKRAVLLDGVFADDDMRSLVLSSLEFLKNSDDVFYILEEKLDAATKRAVAKYAEKVETFDAEKRAPDNAIFKLRFALEGADKKALWVGLQRELIAGKAPEAVHGFLFWAAKQMVLGARDDAKRRRAQTLLIRLATLPHESRRKGFELEYALEQFVLSVA